MYNDEKIEKLVGITANTIKRNDLGIHEARSINAHEGWEVEGVGVYRLSGDKVDAAYIRATKYEREIPSKVDRAEALLEIGSELIQERSYATVVEVNNSAEGWSLPNRDYVNEGAIRFSEEGLKEIWEAERRRKVSQDLAELSSDSLYRNYIVLHEDQREYEMERYHQWYDKLRAEGARVNNEGWNVPGAGSYQLEYGTLVSAIAGSDFKYSDSQTSSLPDAERLRDAAVHIMEGRGITLEEAREENARGGLRVPKVATVHLEDKILTQAWEIAHAREQHTWKEAHAREQGPEQAQVKTETRVAVASASRGDDWSR